PRVKAMLKGLPPRQRVLWLTGAVVVVLALVALVLWLGLGPGWDSPSSSGSLRSGPVPQRVPATLFVGHAGQANAIDSVQLALLRARSGDCIVLLDDLQEPLRWDGKDQNKDSIRDVTIEAEKGTVTWRLPKEQNDGLVFSAVNGLHLKGLTL